MAKRVIVHDISSIASEKAVTDLFVYCGSIKELELVKDDKSDKQIAYVTFEEAEAARTAVMLSDASLEGSPIRIELDENYSEAKSSSCACSSCTCSTCSCSNACTCASCSCSSCSCSTCACPSCSDSSDSSSSCCCSSCSLKQEDKPKSAIFAEILAGGYKLTDAIIQKGIDFDASIGLSARVKNYLSRIQENIKSMDEHYKVSEIVTAKAVEFNERYAVHDKVKYATTRALDTNAGKRMIEFYLNRSKQAIDVYQEAKRIANERSKTIISSETNENVQQ